VIVGLLVLALLFGLYYYNNRVERLVRRVLTRRRKVTNEYPDTEPADRPGHEPHRGRLPGHS
jgi:hypothetical protein